jgi:hypothetical protein
VATRISTVNPKRAMPAAMLALALAAGAALAAGPPHPSNKVLGFSTCGRAVHYTFLFWPRGRPAISSLNLTRSAEPQLEAYAGAARRYPRASVVASATASGVALTRAGCRAFEPKVSIGFRGRGITAHPAALLCTFHAPPVHELARLGTGGIGYSAIDPPKLQVLYAQLTQTRSRLAYDSSFCRLKPPPH